MYIHDSDSHKTTPLYSKFTVALIFDSISDTKSIARSIGEELIGARLYTFTTIVIPNNQLVLLEFQLMEFLSYIYHCTNNDYLK